ncbi:hypothetical protein LZ32DRAFT_688219 [Colletotrichum eremochloae]|nr:hypothetical protein LZ32DRAFT_688219 [Colletotrichum eremochloae]
MWTCCYCGQGGMTVVVDPCPNCRYPRCSRCRVERVQTRQHQQQNQHPAAHNCPRHLL